VRVVKTGGTREEWGRGRDAGPGGGKKKGKKGGLKRLAPRVPRERGFGVSSRVCKRKRRNSVKERKGVYGRVKKRSS